MNADHDTTLRARVAALPAEQFVLTGAVWIGVALALLVHAVVLAGNSEGDIPLAPRNALHLLYLVAVLVPTLGVLGATRLRRWVVGPGEIVGASLPVPTLENPAIAARDSARSATLDALRDSLARADRATILRRTLVLVAIGYGYVVAVAAGLIWLTVWAITSHHAPGQLVYVFGSYTFFVLSTLWVRLVPPDGRRITRATAPALFDAIDDLRRRVDAPPVDEVRVSDDLNAAVTELPRLGIIGLPRRYLVIGLPLLEALTTDEIRAILAHEMAHLSRRHGRTSAWLGRLGVTWLVLGANAGGRNWAAWLFRPILGWFVPRFELHVQALSRAHEHESDSLAAAAAGNTAMGMALVRLTLSHRLLAQSFLPSVMRESADRVDPPQEVFERMAAVLRAGPSREDALRWTRSMLAERTRSLHSHPSLADRLATLGMNVTPDDAERVVDALLDPRRASAADDLIGAQRLRRLRQLVENAWSTEVMDGWRRLRVDAAIWRDGERAGGEPTLDVLWAHARWSAACEPPAEALPRVRAVLAHDPTHAEALVLLGKVLLESDDEGQRAEGARALEAVVMRETLAALEAAGALAQYYERMGWRSEASRVEARERRLKQSFVARLAERSTVGNPDLLEPFRLPEQVLERIRKGCAVDPSIRRAYVVRKPMRNLSEQPLLLLGVEGEVPWYKPASGEDARARCQALLKYVEMPQLADVLVVPVEKRTRLRNRLAALPGAEVYRRGEPSAERSGPSPRRL